MDSRRKRLNERRFFKAWALVGLLALAAEVAVLSPPRARAAITFSVIANIPVGNFCLRPVSVAANSKTQRIYVGSIDNCNNFNPSSVFVIDGDPASLTFNTVIATIAVGAGNLGIAVNSATNRIYVSNHFDNFGNPGTVSVIDGNTNTQITKVTVGCGPTGVGVNPVTNLVYVSNGCSADVTPSTVSVVDGTTNTVTATITGSTGGFSAPDGIGVNPSVNRIFVANSGPASFGGDTVSVIDVTNNANTFVKKVPVGVTPEGVAISVATDDVYVANGNSNSVSVIDGDPASPTANTVIDTVTVGANPSSAAIDETKNRVFVTNVGSNNVSVVDGTNNMLIDGPVSVGTFPVSVAVEQTTAKFSLAYVSNEASGTVSVIK